IDIHLLFTNPCRYYWGDILDRAFLTSRKKNELIRSYWSSLNINLGILFFRKRQNLSRLFYNITALGYSYQQALARPRCGRIILIERLGAQGYWRATATVIMNTDARISVSEWVCQDPVHTIRT
ncbi:hypothetical protein CE195_08500, partial [Sodalis-like symbiont of Philaenus spumarius]